jgi:hypothetical protein
MYIDPEEAAYCIGRITTSAASADAATDSCARAAHVGFAEAYGVRLASLKRMPPRLLPLVGMPDGETIDA